MRGFWMGYFDESGPARAGGPGRRHRRLPRLPSGTGAAGAPRRLDVRDPLLRAASPGSTGREPPWSACSRTRRSTPTICAAATLAWKAGAGRPRGPGVRRGEPGPARAGRSRTCGCGRPRPRCANTGAGATGTWPPSWLTACLRSRRTCSDTAAADETDMELLRQGGSRDDADWISGAEALRERGWLDGSDRLTAVGVRERNRIEQLTDEAAAGPWRALGRAPPPRSPGCSAPWPVRSSSRARFRSRARSACGGRPRARTTWSPRSRPPPRVTGTADPGGPRPAARIARPACSARHRNV